MKNARRVPVQQYPAVHEDLETHRLMVLYEENRMRPHGEVPFSQLRSIDQGNEQLVDTMSTDGVHKLFGRWVQGPSLHRFLPADLSDALVQQISELRQSLRALLPREREVLRLYFERGFSQEKIAAKLSISRLRVRQIYDTAIFKLRRSYANKFKILGGLPSASRT